MQVVMLGVSDAHTWKYIHKLQYQCQVYPSLPFKSWKELPRCCSGAAAAACSSGVHRAEFPVPIRISVGPVLDASLPSLPNNLGSSRARKEKPATPNNHIQSCLFISSKPRMQPICTVQKGKEKKKRLLLGLH